MRRCSSGQRVQIDAPRRDARGVRQRARRIALQLIVVQHAAGHGVDQQHLAGLQPPLALHARRGKRERAGFGREHHEIVRSHCPSAGAQPVAIERGADHATIRERQGGGTIPGLHHGRMELVERAPLRIHQSVALPRLGNEHHQRLRQGAAAVHEKFEHVVERRRVALVGTDDRIELLEIGAEHAEVSVPSRTRIQFVLPRSVLISPLWQSSRYGWARDHVGKVLVENRLCTSAIAVTHCASARSR